MAVKRHGGEASRCALDRLAKDLAEMARGPGLEHPPWVDVFLVLHSEALRLRLEVRELQEKVAKLEADVAGRR